MIRRHQVVFILILVILMFFCGLLYACLLYIQDGMWHRLPSSTAYHITIVPAVISALFVLTNPSKKAHGISITIALYALLSTALVLMTATVIHYEKLGAFITDEHWHISGLSFLLIHGLWLLVQMIITIARHWTGSKYGTLRSVRWRMMFAAHSLFFLLIYFFFEIAG